MPFTETWASAHWHLRSARSNRHPSALWVAPLGRFFQDDGEYSFRLCVRGRHSASSKDILLQNASEVPSWAKLGWFWRCIIPFQCGQADQCWTENGQCYANNVLQSALCPDKVSTIGIFLANKRQKFPYETHVTADASIHILWRITFWEMFHGEAAIHTVSSLELFTIEGKFPSSGASPSGSKTSRYFLASNVQKRWNTYPSVSREDYGGPKIGVKITFSKSSGLTPQSCYWPWETLPVKKFIKISQL